MTRKPERKPVPIPIDPGTQDVSLRLALALCLAEDVEEGLTEINRSTD